MLNGAKVRSTPTRPLPPPPKRRPPHLLIAEIVEQIFVMPDTGQGVSHVATHRINSIDAQFMLRHEAVQNF